MIDEYGSPLRSQAWFSSQGRSMIVEAGGTFFARAMSRSYFERGACAPGLIAMLLCLVGMLILR
jgi:hypothetical protein